ESCKWQCPTCHREYCISDHVKERVWRDLDSGIYQVYLHARIPRVECPEHGKVQSRFSMRFESLALQLMGDMDIKNS
ncbi:transposase IS204/IS1001/IS1096/IS1165 family protein, partial [mine drainage metagenome]